MDKNVQALLKQMQALVAAQAATSAKPAKPAKAEKAEAVNPIADAIVKAGGFVIRVSDKGGKTSSGKHRIWVDFKLGNARITGNAYLS